MFTDDLDSALQQISPDESPTLLGTPLIVMVAKGIITADEAIQVNEWVKAKHSDYPETIDLLRSDQIAP